MEHKDLASYLKKLQNPAPEWQLMLEKTAARDQIPIMERQGIDFLKQLLRLKQPDRILEIGTAIGYSALQMNDAVPDAEIVTIERELKRGEQAEVYFERYDQQNKIKLILGDAFESVESAEESGPYDVIFIDAAKGQYQRFFENFSPMLKEQGVIITDNVLFHGFVIDPSSTSRGLRSLVKKIDNYNQWLSVHPDYMTEFIPIGDGIAISIKK